ncbi:MAG: very-short-patch-repair endonuclease [Candidatus Binatia bacterium]|jgi:very-short-patch-repair endonuclease
MNNQKIPESRSQDSASSMSLKLNATLASKIGFASHQNSVAVLQELDIENSGEEPLRDLVVKLDSDPVFLEPKIWKIDLLEPGANVRVSDRNVKLDGALLSNLTESIRGEVTIKVTQEGNGELPLASEAYPIEVLAKTHWGGVGSMPELLPAFCMPNDPAVDKILKGASDVLKRAGKAADIDGYKNRSRSRTWELASAIWSAVAGLQLGYALPPASFEVEGQKVRTPGGILEGRLATCLDTSMLFASALEQAGLNALLILSEGHAFVGVWLQPQEFSQLVTDEAASVRKRIELQEMLVFETTLATHSPTPPFSAAVAATTKNLSDDEFLMAIDIRRARMRKIRPLGFVAESAAAGSDTDAPSAPADALEEAPSLPGFDVEIVRDPETTDDRVAQWQRKLLDLTARNRLLHLPERSKHVPLFCPNPGALEDLLAAGRTIRISPFPDLEQGGRDAALYEQQNREDLREQFAREALGSNEVLSTLPKKKLESDLVDLYRKARTDMDEGGANTLFLALGFLNWKKTAEDPRSYRAPLILLPVKLKRKSALSGVSMVVHEDEPRFNLTLLELLRQDFDLNITGLDGDLPEDHSGIDVNGIWNIVRVAVKEIPGFEVAAETALGTFSFAKHLMWKDLTDRRDQLTANSVVKHLIERGEEKFGADSESEYPNERELDSTISPAELFTPLPADSSQLAAVVASARGCNFVLDGPPGTGKSQTIANMITHNLSIGKRVLFVAEKMAALDVVHRRLEEKGIADFCLEVHSHKTSKTDILQQLDRAWNARGNLTQEDWARETDRLKTLRDRLNLVCDRLHSRHSNGMTAHQAISLIVRDHNSATPRLNWSNGTQHSVDEFEAMRETAHRLDLNFDAFSDAPEDFSFIEQTEWSNGWQEAVIAAARAVPSSIAELIAARDGLMKSCQLDVSAETDQAMERLATFVRVALSAHQKDLGFAFAPNLTEKLEAAHRFIALLQDYKAEEEKLSVRYGAEAARNIDPDQLDSNWSEANQKFWFFANLARRRVAKELAEKGSATSRPDVAADAPRLRRLKELLIQMDELIPLLAGIPGCAGLKSTTSVIEEAIEIAAELQRQLPLLTSDLDDLISLKAATRRLAVDANELLAAEGPIAMAAAGLEGALREFRKIDDHFCQQCAITNRDALSLDDRRTASHAITASETRLRAWCAWRRVRLAAIHQNLGPLVARIEDGSLPKGSFQSVFLTAYSKWFASQVIDSEPILRDFVAAEHMDSIKEFRKVDDQVALLSVEYTRTVLCGQLPTKSEVGRKDGYGILKHELQKKRSHKPLRKLASEMGEAFGRLAPCMLMSPLSIAQYLPADQQLFDLVIFDEASQITPWDAVGSIARGTQVVIAGDPRQMPPTNFFQRGAAESEFDGNVEGDLESILDECLSVGIPRHSLNWHYRSRHESLIAFSNHRYYGGNLITFPAAETRASAVSWRHVSGVYAKGKARTNQIEAEAMVAEIVRRLTSPAAAEKDLSLGIITLNSDQQKLVEDLLDAARKKHPEMEPYFGEELSEPVVVKNLETVQGDERDVILLGIGYGPTELGAGTMSMNFGPLNRDGGERRLNVALTRSKQEMIIFTSFDPSMIDLNRTSARAVRDLKHFLEFAERGPRALAEAVQGSVGGYESPFEEAVANRLMEKGWEVVPQVGVSRFRIDLGVVHPKRPGDFLVGVECDGATYHSGATARDRDKVRASVLEGLGWTLLRVWSTDWFVDQEREIEQLDAALRAILEKDEEQRAAKKSKIAEAEEALAKTVPPDFAPPREEVPVESTSPESAPPEAATDEFAPDASSVAIPDVAPYQIVDFADLMALVNPERFYDDTYSEALLQLVSRTLETEAPIMDDLLIQRVARVHGFKRAGRRIRERVLEIVDKHFHLQDDPIGGTFVWIGVNDPGSWTGVRGPSEDGSARRIEEISTEEIRALLTRSSQPPSVFDIAGIFGVKRLSATSRERIESVLEMHRTIETEDTQSELNERVV